MIRIKHHKSLCLNLILIAMAVASIVWLSAYHLKPNIEDSINYVDDNCAIQKCEYYEPETCGGDRSIRLCYKLLIHYEIISNNATYQTKEYELKEYNYTCLSHINCYYDKRNITRTISINSESNRIAIDITANIAFILLAFVVLLYAFVGIIKVDVVWNLVFLIKQASSGFGKPGGTLNTNKLFNLSELKKLIYQIIKI